MIFIFGNLIDINYNHFLIVIILIILMVVIPPKLPPAMLILFPNLKM
jgi:Sec-independent protein translocase protein TatA